VLLNGNQIGLIEVKYRLTPKDIRKFAKHSIPLFKQIFPQYANSVIYGGVAGLSYADGALNEAQEQGLFALANEGMEVKFLNESVNPL